MPHGRVKSYNYEEGYGWISVDGVKDVWVHFSGIHPDTIRFPTGFKFLKEGQIVAFDLRENPFSVEQARVALNLVIMSD
ncbi:cold-shock protein [Paenibacillus sp. CF384]|uniref:cold-shock protein n=1 Tax=Paenibacillus sp. CF384 TaxID=1884382 RepID=UPI000897E1D9|nr:cold shock domain-containing protein [Paenibacillus sp. CF384]SDX06429.1 cold shock protein (beta-ribbon, CspA family) [Paenibacillus sp. CF384]